MSAFIDVVIPAHDAADTIEEAVRSARRQSYAAARLIVVADACSDDTAARARAAGAEVIETDMRSPGGARNLGLEAATATYVAFLDADDLWLPSWLAAVSRAAERAPHAWLLYGAVEEVDAKGRRVRVQPSPTRGGDLFEALLAGNFITTSACVVRREEALGVGGFEPSLRAAEDWDLWLRLADRGPLAPVPGRHVVYRRVEGSLSRSPARFLRARDDGIRAFERALGLRPTPPDLQRRALARILAWSAMRLLSRDLVGPARVDLRSALELTPLDGELWMMAALSVLSPRWRQAALRARTALRFALPRRGTRRNR